MHLWRAQQFFSSTVKAFFKKVYVFIFERVRVSRGGGGAEREREKEYPKQAPHCQHRA